MEPSRVRVTTAQEYVELELRVAVLEGLVNWLLSNGVLTKPLESEDLSAIYEEAVETVRRHHPNAEIDIKYEDFPRGGSGVVPE